MQISYTTTPLMRSQAARSPYSTLSRAAKARYTWILWYYAHGQNQSLTARHFGIGRPTLSRWLDRYRPHHLQTLENQTSKPYRLRRPEWTTELAIAVRELRIQFPRWGKKKLIHLLRRLGYHTSQSTVGRILRHLKATGQLREALRKVKQRSRVLRRAWAIRKPKEFRARAAGELVQVDTMFLEPLSGVHLKQLTLVDVHSRFAAVEIASNATALRTKKSLEKMLGRLPFRVSAIQVDGGSEFMSEFEEFCQETNRQLYVLPPHSPKLNGRVERLNRTTREELHECSNAEATVAGLSGDAAEWEQIYNTIRPHEALGFLTPKEFLEISTPNQGVTR